MSEINEPIRLPQNPPADDENVTITINPKVIYYLVFGTVCFIAGFFVAWMLSTAGNTNTVRAAQATAFAEARATALIDGANGQDSGAVQYPVKIDITGSPAWGADNAKVTIVEYSDFECPYCERYFQDTYQLIKQNYGSRVKYVFKHFPLPIHPNAFPAALAAECAKEQGKFWEFHNVTYADQSDLSRTGLLQKAQKAGVADMNQFASCLDTRKYANVVQANEQEGSQFGVGGTPTFFINGIPLVGAQPYTNFQKAIDSALQVAGG